MIKNNKYINISGLGVDDDDSKGIIIWRKKSNINLKINNNFLDINKNILKYLYIIYGKLVYKFYT